MPTKKPVVVITGATSGIGEVAAARLAGMGARIVLVARDLTRGQEMLARLAAGGGGSAHSVYYGDLSLIAETKRVAAQIANFADLDGAWLLGDDPWHGLAFDRGVLSPSLQRGLGVDDEGDTFPSA